MRTKGNRRDIVLIRAAQEEGALNVQLTLGNQKTFANLKVPLAFIIGDDQGGDGICGRPVSVLSESCKTHM